MTPFPAPRDRRDPFAPDEAATARHQASVATYHALRDAAREGYIAGAQEYRAELVKSPIAAFAVLREALDRLGASDESWLAFHRLYPSVVDDIATKAKPDVAFSLRAYREERG